MAVSKTQPTIGDRLYFRGEDKIPYLKERDLRADIIYCHSLSWEQSPGEIARDMDLLLESVNQAIDWCHNNGDLVTRILDAKRREAGIKD